MLVLAQALDNRGPDACCFYGNVLDAADPIVRSPISAMSSLVLRCRPICVGRTSFYEGVGWIALRIRSDAEDEWGRAAVLALYVEECETRDPWKFATKASRCALLLGRNLDEDALAAEVREWRRERGSPRKRTRRTLARISADTRKNP